MGIFRIGPKHPHAVGNHIGQGMKTLLKIVNFYTCMPTGDSPAEHTYYTQTAKSDVPV